MPLLRPWLLAFLLTFAPGFGPAATLRIPAWIEDTPSPLGRVRFESTLNGAPAPVSAQFGPSTDQIVLVVLDLAGNVSYVDPARQALIDEINKLPENAWIGLLRAQDGLHVLADPGPDRAPVLQAIRDLASSGKAGLLDTLLQSLSLADAMMRKSSARVSVLYITDSNIANYRDDYTNPVINQSDPHDLSRRFPEQLIVEKVDKLVEGLQTLQPPLFIVHLHYRGSRLNQAYQSGLKTLTDATGGESEICRSIAEIPTAISAMFARISSAWSLTLSLPPRSHPDLRIRVSAYSGDRELHISTRSRFTLKRK